jgi:hypothetical protein
MELVAATAAAVQPQNLAISKDLRKQPGLLQEP